MASFTDIIPQFTPYREQVPVQALVEVGMEKQRRYDEGLQKIQANIENISGLPVGNSADKAYLQSSLNSLGSKLKSVAGGDFSNYQLVNSVGGMANQIIKDPVIQTAVKSAAWYKKQSEEMEKAISEGKSSQSNIWDFNEKSSKWLNAEKAGQAFNDRYTPYVDVQKQWMEVMKGLHSDLKEVDIPYERNPDGSINYNRTAAAMQKISKETVSSAKIENALRASLSPDQLNQLSIDGRYQFRNLDTPEKLEVYSKSRFNQQIASNNDLIKQLEGVKNLSKSNSDEYIKAENAIKSLSSLNQDLNNQLSEELELMRQDPDLAKSTIYKNGAITQFAKAFSWEHNKENLLANPVLAAEHWEKEYALDRAQFNLSVKSQNWKEYMDTQNLDLNKKEYQLKVEKQLKEMFGGSSPFETYKGNSTQVKDPLSAMQLDEIEYTKSANQGVNEMVKGIPGTTPDQILSAIKKYKDGDPNWYLLQNGNTKKAIPVEWRDEVNNIIDNQNKANRLTQARQKVQSEVDQTFKLEESKILSGVKGLPGISIKTQSGKVVNFTSTEIANFMSNRQLVISQNSLFEKGEARETFRRPLTQKEKLLVNYTPKSSETSKVWSEIANKVKPLSNISSKKQKAVQEKLLEMSGDYVPRITTISFSSEGGDIARRNWENITDAVLSRYSDEGGAKELNKSDIEKAKTWVSSEGKSNIIYKKLVQGDRTFLVLNKGGEEVTIPLEKIEAKQLPLVDPNEPDDEYKEVTKAQYLGNGSTNPTGNYEDAYFGKPQMPNANLDVKADLSWNKSNNAKQYIQLQLNTPLGVVPLQLDDSPLSRQDAINFLRTATKNQIKQLYLKSPSIDNRYKEAIKNL